MTAIGRVIPPQPPNCWRKPQRRHASCAVDAIKSYKARFCSRPRRAAGMIGGMPDSASSAEPAPPPGIDITKPNIARVYDYWLDGKDNFAVDRALGDRLLAIDPGMRDLVRGNREFLCAAVARAAHEGGIG